MVVFVLDSGAQMLIDQVLRATDVARRDIGTIGDEEHRKRKSAHNPEDPPPPGNPPHQVDAVDFPHQPDKGLDCAVFTEDLRTSRDVRLELVIWNRQQFSSYAVPGYEPFVWRPYKGEDPHTGHCHVQVNDTQHDQTRPWKVFDMADNWDRVYKVLDDDDDGKADGVRDGDTTGHSLMVIRSRTYNILQKLESGGVTDEQLEKIAQRVVELLSDNIIFVPKAKTQ